MLLVFQRGDMVRRCGALSVSYFSDCFMEEAYEGDLDVIFNYGSGRRPQGLSWGRANLQFREYFRALCASLLPLGWFKNLNGNLCSAVGSFDEPPELFLYFYFFIFYFFRTSSSSSPSSTGFFFFFFLAYIGLCNYRSVIALL